MCHSERSEEPEDLARKNKALNDYALPFFAHDHLTFAASIIGLAKRLAAADAGKFNIQKFTTTLLRQGFGG